MTHHVFNQGSFCHRLIVRLRGDSSKRSTETRCGLIEYDYKEASSTTKTAPIEG